MGDEVKIEILHPETGEVVAHAETPKDGESPLVGLMTRYDTDREGPDDKRLPGHVGAGIFITGLSEADVLALKSRWLMILPVTRKES